MTLRVWAPGADTAYRRGLDQVHAFGVSPSGSTRLGASTRVGVRLVFGPVQHNGWGTTVGQGSLVRRGETETPACPEFSE
ncbi:hypothetical protein GCM10010174_38700 [Kutzneria viridogrisea]